MWYWAEKNRGYDIYLGTWVSWRENFYTRTFHLAGLVRDGHAHVTLFTSTPPFHTRLARQNFYLTVMDALWPLSNETLFLIEGCGQGGLNGANWWV